jgi:ATPase subunit of ABC transporter with duplicated ATPase domains
MRRARTFGGERGAQIAPRGECKVYRFRMLPKMPIVRLDKVSLSFGLKPLLDNVNLQLRRGERVCLLGRNGEGKSSLLQVICKNLLPDSGEVWVRPGARVASLAQEVSSGSDAVVRDVVLGGAERGAADEDWQAELQGRSSDLAPGASGGCADERAVRRLAPARDAGPRA